MFNTNNVYKPVTGLTVPIGISFSWGKRFRTHNNIYKRQTSPYLQDNGTIKSLRGNSFTLFLSIIDIAAPVSYRFSTNTNAEGLPSSVKWAQLLAPGLHGILGVKNLPLCVAAGVQLSPQLRTVKDITATTTTTTNAARVQVSVLFDLPLYNIYHKKPLKF